jgi:hypothetical protein
MGTTPQVAPQRHGPRRPLAKQGGVHRHNRPHRVSALLRCNMAADAIDPIAMRVVSAGGQLSRSPRLLDLWGAVAPMYLGSSVYPLWRHDL